MRPPAAAKDSACDSHGVRRSHRFVTFRYKLENWCRAPARLWWPAAWVCSLALSHIRDTMVGANGALMVGEHGLREQNAALRDELHRMQVMLMQVRCRARARARFSDMPPFVFIGG